MNIRSLTIGAAMPQDEAGRASLIARMGDFAHTGKAALESAGFTVQTTRLSTQPAEKWLQPEGAAQSAKRTGDLCAAAGIDFMSLGTIQVQGQAHSEPAMRLIASLPEILASAENLFASVQVGDRETGGINLEAVRASAEVIAALAQNTPDGFGNLRFAAAANCPPHVPFYPASYYKEDDRNRGEPEFGLALEAADIPVRAFHNAHSHEEARSNLLAMLVDEGERAAQVCSAIGADHGYTFTGLDISMAPYPAPDRSIGGALEKLSGAPLGAPGTLTAAAFLTGALREARINLPTIGYSGLMLPALEDQTLADRAGQGYVNMDTLLLLSAVCGLGLDTVPVPGDISREQIAKIIMDMAALAIRLDKPLTARLLPVPGKAAGDPAEWPHFPYFAKGRVVQVPPDGTAGLFHNSWLPI